MIKLNHLPSKPIPNSDEIAIGDETGFDGHMSSFDISALPPGRGKGVWRVFFCRRFCDAFTCQVARTNSVCSHIHQYIISDETSALQHHFIISNKHRCGPSGRDM